MLSLEVPHSLLPNIKNAIKALLPSDEKGLESVAITDTLRHEVLTVLISYANQIPHPGGNRDELKEDTSPIDNVKQSPILRPMLSPTLMRWQILAYVAGIDLTIAKWFESHLDALSILNEVGHQTVDDLSSDNMLQGLWAVWAAEGRPLTYQQGMLNGSKAWCSGAHLVKYALMTYRDATANAQLIMVDMHQDGIEIDSSDWQAVGMQATDTATVTFNQVTTRPVGAANAYLDRVGFWHGAAGVAVCWYGAASSIATYLILAYQQKPNSYKAMYLGQLSTAMAVTQQYIYHVANLIDNQPQVSHELAIRQLRANIEQLARQVLKIVGQALGAAPFCRNAHFARLAADLPVFIRQSHGAVDLQKIGELSGDVGYELKDGFTNRPMTDEVNIWQL